MGHLCIKRWASERHHQNNHTWLSFSQYHATLKPILRVILVTRNEWTNQPTPWVNIMVISIHSYVKSLVLNTNGMPTCTGSGVIAGYLLVLTSFNIIYARVSKIVASTRSTWLFIGDTKLLAQIKPPHKTCIQMEWPRRTQTPQLNCTVPLGLQILAIDTDTITSIPRKHWQHNHKTNVNIYTHIYTYIHKYI